MFPGAVRDPARQRWAQPVLLALTFARFLIVSPLLDSPALWASGRFVYPAQQLLRGAALYRDVWGHVPPLIYGLDALGWAIGGLWGIWFIELIFLLGAVLLSYRLLAKAFGGTAAFFGSACWMLGLSLLLQGNQIEEYGLLLQFAALYAFERAESRERASVWSFLTGILIGLLFWLRPDLVGIGAAIAAYLAAQIALRRSSQADARLMTLLIGTLAVIFLGLALLAVGGALAETWSAVVRYNLAVSVSLDDRFGALLTGVKTLGRASLPLITLVAWLVGSVALLRRQLMSESAVRLVAIALIALPVELIISFIDGAQASNHIVVWLPTIGILAASLASILVKSNEFEREAHQVTSPSFSPIPEGEGVGVRAFTLPPRLFLAGLLVAFSLMPLVDAATALQLARTHNFGANDLRAQTIDALRQNTQPDDTLLIWGNEPMVNVLSERRSPTRVFEQLPLFVPVNPREQAPFVALANEINANRPAYVLDTSTGGDRVPPIDPDRRKIWQLNQQAGFLPTVTLTPELQLVLDTVTQYYRPVAKYGTWILYARSDVQPGTTSR